jgi:hypothetical protein
MIRYHRRFIDPQNQYRRWIDPRVRILRVADVTTYLIKRGWTPVASDRPGFSIYQEPPGSVEEGGAVLSIRTGDGGRKRLPAAHV